jgi:erythromycin esterase
MIGRIALVGVCAVFSISDGLAAPGAAFASWARARAVPIDTAADAVRALDAGIAEARLIGVGESVHEVQQFLAFRRELLQELVRTRAVTALVLESGLAEAMDLDEYVRGRRAAVDFEAALPGGLGPFEEMRRTIEWLREWNAGAGRHRPVGIHGADLPARAGSMVPALDRLRAQAAGDPAIESLIESIRPLAVRASHTWWRGAAEKYETLAAEEKATLARDVSLLLERADHLARENRERFEWAQRLAFVVHQQEATLRLGAFSPTIPRDYALAENALWVARRLPPGERAVYWAHNAHIQRVLIEGEKLPPGTFLGSGKRLSVVLGRQYYAIATAYGGASMDDRTLPASGSVDAALESLGIPRFVLPLRGIGEAPPEVAGWLMQERPMRYQVGYLTLPLGTAFDAVVYFDRATPGARVTNRE